MGSRESAGARARPSRARPTGLAFLPAPQRCCPPGGGICRSGVSTSATAMALPSRVTVGATLCVDPSTSAVRLQWFRCPLRYCTRTTYAAMNTFVPGFTVHHFYAALCKWRNRATEVEAREMTEPPLPKGFWALGVSSTVVHSAARLSSNFFVATALAAGTAAKSAIAASHRIPVIRDTATSYSHR